MSEFLKNCLMNKWMNDYDSHVKSLFHGNLDPGCCAHSIISSVNDGYLADIGCIDNGVDLHLIISCLLEWDMGNGRQCATVSCKCINCQCRLKSQIMIDLYCSV